MNSAIHGILYMCVVITDTHVLHTVKSGFKLPVRKYMYVFKLLWMLNCECKYGLTYW